jgi:hypothetical protein
MIILIIFQHHFGVVDATRLTKFYISRMDLNGPNWAISHFSHAFVVDFSVAISTTPSPPLLPYHGQGVVVKNINSSHASRYTSAVAGVPDSRV